ncbi:YceI family protein [Rhizobium ruizarguesonis]|jgi:polyisoprenoid-binding protein YceI|uniref:YceI family protein n=2 Tax=Rhizobium ruizarguesonis TaxID=2081791 RepID=UPI001030A40C|nr:YceI family protein [Rhizobium ruizarguesonis]MBY5852762.1 polyisoprenoid-binding protein [Rhizobium leguminosarum]QND18881.1 polyisoprenoid-binding protein [Rhizobium leguminosarum bv. viciae]MBY5890626.1 polyisoprenoid-binding protein [Rhizobium leguminosarum]QSZ00131.1 polyisoprenoid-binding protein [Rhizobium ruizarguesonis]TAT80057.1 polyisoprenoid-binding protein [Rhizobium ruizarguesonis]
MKFAALVAALTGALFAGSAFAADTYDVDPTHAWVSFKINHAGWSNAHGIFKTVGGTISFDKEDIAKSSISLKLDANSIDTNFDQRDSDLKSPDFLNVEEFPDVTFTSTKIEKTGDKTAKVSGDLSLAGTVKAVTLDVTWNAESPLPWDAKTVKTGFSATGKFNGLDFGLKKLTDFGLGPDLALDIDIEAIKK